MPVCFCHLYVVVFGRGFNVGEGLFAFMSGDDFYLVEAGDGVANVRGICHRLFPFFEKGVDGIGEILLFGRVQRLAIFVSFPGCFHRMSPVSGTSQLSE